MYALAPSEPPVAANEAFVDNFKNLEGARWSISNGWSNGDWSVNDWQRSQVSIQNGLILSLGMKGAAKPFSSGEIQSRHYFKYGRFEVSMKAARGEGVVNGFFTYTGPPRGKPWNEIDVEILGRNTKELQVTYHRGQNVKSAVVQLPFDSATGFHNYAFEWSAQSIKWSVDGVSVHEEYSTGGQMPDVEQQVILDLWGGSNNRWWPGIFAWPGQPVQMSVSCVSYQPLPAAKHQC